MTWIFSRALMESYDQSRCSQALEEEYSETNCSESEPYAQLSVMPTQHKFWRNDKMMDACRLSQFGLTLQVLTESRGEAVLKSFLEGSRAKTSALLGAERESLEKSPLSTCTSLESLAKWEPASSEWRIPQLSLLGESVSFSESWPRWGMMRNGECWARSAWAVSMRDSEYGLLPTPTAHNSKEGAYPSEYQRNTPTLATHAGGKINPEWTEHLMMWPGKWTDLKPLETDKFQKWRHERLLNVYGESK